MNILTYSELLGYRRTFGEIDKRVVRTVERIIERVRKYGDRALIDYAQKFDGVGRDFSIEVTIEEIERANEIVQRDYDKVFGYFMNAAENISIYHQHQIENNWEFEKDGNIFGQILRPIERVGVYVPGGKAFYPSSILMNLVPAKVAGVPEIFLTTTPRGANNPLLLALASKLGAKRIFRVGGAQGIAALAFGTQTIPQVAKITGPGNIFVATAKRLVSGIVGIDSIAGVSELAVLADSSANPEWIAIDLCAQAEHDEQNSVFLISPDKQLIEQVNSLLNRLIPTLQRRDIIRKSIDKNSMAILVQDITQGFDIVNRLAPEHLEVMLEMDKDEILSRVHNAGAIFIGNHSPVAVCDFYAGPNHVLPTNGTAVFSSPLGVYDFVKRSSYSIIDQHYLRNKGYEIDTLARFEGFEAHARSVTDRLV